MEQTENPREVLHRAGVDDALAGSFLEAASSKGLEVFSRGWAILDGLPLRSKRGEREKEAARLVRERIDATCETFCREHRQQIYDRLTAGRTRRLRIDELLWSAAELWRGLVPTREELAREAERMQMDKDGREIQQGLFACQMLSDPEIGTHLVQSMLEPTEEARERLDEFMSTGRVELGTARVETEGHAGIVTFRHGRYLNAEDDETRGAQEVAIDLVLLHPALQMGVLRGDRVDHPKYAGRRIFSAGINLTKIYHGKVSYLFYLLRDLGLVNKLYRGLLLEEPHPDEPETTREKLWTAVVETFAIGGGCQLLLVVDYVLAERGAYLSLPARKEGIIPGAANLRLPRFLGERLAREAILFDRRFDVEEPAARAIVSEVHPPERIDEALASVITSAADSGVVSASGNRKALRVQTEPLDVFRRYMATYAKEQAYCHLSEQLVANLERHWQARSRRL